MGTKVFIGWSGPRSNAVAEALVVWLPSVIQAAEPWLSKGIEPGAAWFPEIGGKLQSAQYGVLCITPENATQPWVLFEAGALALAAGERKACPFLLDLPATALPGPLAQLQAVNADRAGAWAMVQAINTVGDAAGRLEPARLERAFERWWPDLEESISAARLLAHERAVVAQPGVQEMVAEVLTIVRALQRSQSRAISEAGFPTTSYFSVVPGEASPPFYKPFPASQLVGVSPSSQTALEPALLNNIRFGNISPDLAQKIGRLTQVLEQGNAQPAEQPPAPMKARRVRAKRVRGKIGKAKLRP